MADAAHPKTTKAPHKRVGSVVRGKYRVEAFLATGTMANVYAATHRNGAKVALKILHPQLAQDPGLCERFKREGYFANSIGHPGIVRAIDDDVTEDGCAFIVMELLEGETLEERRRRKGGKLALEWVLPVADSLLDILAAAHAREVVHRDLKPDNVFVTKEGAVKVLDFGVARWNDNKSSSDMTGVGMVLGTPAYMPPEQALGRREDVNAQSDLWAVGATLFVVLTGEPVHAGGDAKAKLIATARTAARPIREAAPEIPRSVAAVIDRALAFHKQERWPDAEAMREALRWARMSVEGPAKNASGVPAASGVELDVVPPPVPTRRTVDDEPTVARAAPAPIDAADFMTSAPPITLRDAPRVAGLTASGSMPVSSGHAEPVFSLRREKFGEETTQQTITNELGSPSTERIPKDEAARDIASAMVERINQALAGPASGDAAPRESGQHANAMPQYDPATDMGGGDETPASIEPPERSIEVNLSFTRPMAAIVMPDDYPAPRPAAGAPPPVYPSNTPPAAQLSSSPPPQQAFTGPPPPHLSSPPVITDARAHPQLASTVPHFSSPPPYEPPHGTTPPAVASSRPSLPVDAPGPLLSQIAPPKSGRFARIAIPLAILLLAAGAGVLAIRARAASVRAAAAAAAKSAVATADPNASGSGAPGASSAAGAPSTTPSTPGGPGGDPAGAATAAANTGAVATIAAPSPSASVAVVKKKKKPKPKPKPEPDQGSEAPPPTATATAEPEPEATTKDPAPAPVPTPTTAPAPTTAPTAPSTGTDGF